MKNKLGPVNYSFGFCYELILSYIKSPKRISEATFLRNKVDCKFLHLTLSAVKWTSLDPFIFLLTGSVFLKKVVSHITG